MSLSSLALISQCVRKASRRVASICPEKVSHRLYEMRRRVARIEMSTFYAVLSVRPHTVCNRNLDIRTGQGDLGS